MSRSVVFSSAVKNSGLNSKTAKQIRLGFFKPSKPRQEHGGSLAVQKRRARRVLRIKQTHHITLKSHHAIGARSLFRHKKVILGIMRKNALKFQVKVYEYAIQGNHIHLLLKSQNREGMQNFFRVFAGHVAQTILRECPLPLSAGGAPHQGKGCRKNQRKFWSFLLYSRVVSWGRDFKNVVGYIQRNTLELLHLVDYKPRIKIRPGGAPNQSFAISANLVLRGCAHRLKVVLN